MRLARSHRRYWQTRIFITIDAAYNYAHEKSGKCAVYVCVLMRKLFRGFSRWYFVCVVLRASVRVMNLASCVRREIKDASKAFFSCHYADNGKDNYFACGTVLKIIACP